MERLVEDADAMRALGAALGRAAQPGDVLALVGDLGAGKTVLVQGLAVGLGYDGAVTSPTFTLIHIYDGGRLPLYHADLYRLERAAELEDIGLDDVFRQPAVAAVEWADRIPGAVPAEALELRIEVVSENVRRITWRPGSPRAAGWASRVF